MSHLTQAPPRPPAVLRPAPRRPPRVPPARPGRTLLALAPLFVLHGLICLLAQPGSSPVRDEADLLAAAARLLDGQLVPDGVVWDPRAYLWHGPGIVALLAPLVALDLPLPAVRFMEPVLLGAAMLLFHRLLRVRLAPRAALGWTYGFGLYVPFFSVLPGVHKEPLAVLLVVGGMLALTRALGGGRWPFVVGAGLALGALTMVRLEYGWVALALLGLALAHAARRRSAGARRLVAVAGVAVLACVPWLAYTYELTGKPLYWGTSSGLSLFWMSPTVPGETGQWYEPESGRTDPRLAGTRPLFDRVERMHPVRSDRVLREEAVRRMRARPAAYVRNLAANTTRLFFSTPMRPAQPVSVAAYGVSNGLLLAGVGWAGAVLWRRRRRLPPETVPLALFAALAILVHVPPSASPRMLLPVAPVLMWFVAQAARARA